jgi:co-chaperonin GroES (HSP10)
MAIEDFKTLEEAFPECDHGVVPLGARMLIQLKSVKKASSGGIILVDETRETERVQSMVGKILALGPLCFKNRDTAQEWPEGTWVKQGDYIRVPRWSGDRFTVPSLKDPEEMVSLQILNDHECWCRVEPEKVLQMKAFV